MGNDKTQISVLTKANIKHTAFQSAFKRSLTLPKQFLVTMRTHGAVTFGWV